MCYNQKLSDTLAKDSRFHRFQTSRRYCLINKAWNRNCWLTQLNYWNVSFQISICIHVPSASFPLIQEESFDRLARGFIDASFSFSCQTVCFFMGNAHVKDWYYRKHCDSNRVRLGRTFPPGDLSNRGANACSLWSAICGAKASRSWGFPNFQF